MHKKRQKLCVVMYDKSKPYNELPLLPPDVNLESVEILKLADQAGVELSRFNEQVADSRLMFISAVNLIQHFAVFEAVDSSKVENIVTTTEEVFEARALPESERSDAQKETLRYVDALIHGSELLFSQDFLNTNSFIDIQATLEPNKSGIRNLPGTQIANKATGEVFYTPPEGQRLIRDLLKNYEEFFNDQSGEVNALIKMAILHYQFEAIHPFPDGNGRTGRILLPLYLMSQKRMRHPVLFLSGYILKTRTEYYTRLRRVTSHGEWEEWVLYMLRAVLEQAIHTKEYLVAITELAETMQRDMEAKLPKLASKALIEYLIMEPVLTRQKYADEFRISLNTATSHLQQFTKYDFVVTEKYKTTRLYFNEKFLVVMKKFHQSVDV